MAVRNLRPDLNLRNNNAIEVRWYPVPQISRTRLIRPVHVSHTEVSVTNGLATVCIHMKHGRHHAMFSFDTYADADQFVSHFNELAGC